MEYVRTSVYLDEDDVEFLKERGIVIAKLANIVAEEALKGNPPEENPSEVESVKIVPVRVRKDLHEELRKKNLNLSALIRARIRELKKVL